MDDQKLSIFLKKLKISLFLSLLLSPVTIHASFIESTMGAAVVNDATATYFNPAALVLLKNTQVIGLNSLAHFRTEFTGQAIQTNTGFTQSGRSPTQTHYNLPSLYLGIPVTNKIAVGLALISNFINKDLDGNSILRYAQSGNRIQNLDIVPALEYKINDYFSLGASANFSYASFLLTPTFGFPSLDIPDSQSHNECNGWGTGGDVGLLVKFNKSTMMGFNYRSSVTYRLSGTSIFEGTPRVISNHYGFTFWTPARSVLSINHLITPSLGIIGTVQRIQWSIFKDINIHGIAIAISNQPVIFDATVPYHFKDRWLLTLGSHYQITSKWRIRVAGTYNQSPGNPHYQIINGDSIILGTSMAYDISKNITIDGSYAHAFIQKANINAITKLNHILGETNGSVDVISLKLTFNIT